MKRNFAFLFAVCAAAVTIAPAHAATITLVPSNAVALPGDTAKTGDPVWYGGGKLAADLTLPKLRRRWHQPRCAWHQLVGHGAFVIRHRPRHERAGAWHRSRHRP